MNTSVTTPAPYKQLDAGYGIRVDIYGLGLGWEPHRQRADRYYAANLFAPLCEKVLNINDLYIVDSSAFNAEVVRFPIIDCERVGYSRVRSRQEPVDGIYDSFDPNSHLRKGFVLSTADCPSILIIDHTEKTVAILHAGRGALHPLDRDGNLCRPKERSSVVDAYFAVTRPKNPMALRAHIMCGIAPVNFFNHWTWQNGGGFYELVTQYFMDRCGERAVYGAPEAGQFNLPFIIERQLLQHGMLSSRIFAPDGIDTFSNLNLASIRRNRADTKRNAIIVSYPA